ncbi:MAG: glycosyltransferase family 4 protein [Candidatus Faecivicinus sp.]
MSRIKVLWVCNIPIPRIANEIGVKAPNICGWLTGFADVLEQIPEIDLHIAFPLLGEKAMRSGSIGNIHYYAFHQPKMWGFLPVEDQMHCSREMEEHLRTILQKVQPDILHCFGTEYPHSMLAAKLFNRPERTVVNIQGLTSYYWMHYNAGIPYRELKRFAVSNIARGNLAAQAEKMKRRGAFETETLKRAGHVIGRTDWDEACTSQTNPDASYHFCNESLREVFYSGVWEPEKCEKHSIFMSQAAYPVKGLHFMLRALPEILRVYPDAHLFVAGNDLTRSDGLYARLKMSSYAKYVRRIIAQEGLAGHVTFTGPLTEEEMKARFLKSNVFVSPSTIENSPNSLGEAMLLGLPCVSSDVGGVKNLMLHEKEGYIYQADAPYMLAYYVKKVFADPKRATQMGLAARSRAQVTHNREANIARLIEIYREILAS